MKWSRVFLCQHLWINKKLIGPGKFCARCRSGAFGRSETYPIFWSAHFATSKRKPLDLQVFSRIGTNEKVTVTSKYYHEHQRTGIFLIKFTYLMSSKLLYLLKDEETFSYVPALEQVSAVIRALQTSTLLRFLTLTL